MLLPLLLRRAISHGNFCSAADDDDDEEADVPRRLYARPLTQLVLLPVCGEMIALPDLDERWEK